MKIKHEKLDALALDPANARLHDARNLAAIKASLEAFGQRKPIVVAGGVVVAGNGTLEAARALGWESIATVSADDLDETQRTAFAIADNRTAELADWDAAKLAEALALVTEDGDELGEATGFDHDTLVGLIEQELGGEVVDAAPVKLSDRFLVPPFSVLDARQGYWQDRKREWLALGISSEQGRGDNLMTLGPLARYAKSPPLPTTSVFDPLLCELAYRWFAPKRGVVLDPFAGGSVRGIVASRLGLRYVGQDLQEPQVVANREQAGRICSDPVPEWRVGDSRHIGDTCRDVSADFVFSCPPYADLERYSDDPADLSTMPYSEFLESYRRIISESCKLLAEDSFACFVVGEVRGKDGTYHNFVGDTVEAFRGAGLSYYNEAILVSPAGTLPIRAGVAFAAGRKLGKAHQNVLVFVKGDWRRAHERLGSPEVSTDGPPPPVAEA